jgi:hypothetical protein
VKTKVFATGKKQKCEKSKKEVLTDEQVRAVGRGTQFDDGTLVHTTNLSLS